MLGLLIILKHLECPWTFCYPILYLKNVLKIKCNLCKFTADLVDKIWNHKLDVHTGEYFDVKNVNENDKQNMLFSLVAEQNVELMADIESLKKGVKAVLEQFTYDL